MDNNNIGKNIIKFINKICLLPKMKDESYNENVNLYISQLLLELKRTIDFDNITVSQLSSLGCRKLTTGGSVNGMEIYLLPSYILPILPIGLKVYEYHDGRELIYDGSNIGDESDNTGYLNVGLIPVNKK